MYKNVKHSGRNNYQRGVVLVVALLILLVLTLIGLAATQGTTLEEKMAGNRQGHNRAFQAAEASMIDAQHQLAIGNICTAFDGTQGCYAPPDPTSVGATSLWESIDWSASANKTFAYSGTLDGLESKPRYFVQQLPPEPAPGQNLGQAEYGNVPPLQFLQITAEATTGDEPGEVILQGGYRP
ncbi:MAG TPA: PilX N-terminal domain-containing pilus assembly protein [Gammaproteobacteria bacterium]|nr:PilX N-terminal domain-containing pilus assembly protein [Gammaproteobacteria bacterium]